MTYLVRGTKRLYSVLQVGYIVQWDVVIRVFQFDEISMPSNISPVKKQMKLFARCDAMLCSMPIHRSKHYRSYLDL